MLEVHGASYEVRGKPLVTDIDLTLEPGRLVALAGPNGAGKSTLLRLLSGEFAPTRGTVTMNGRDLRRIPASELARRRAVVPQANALSFPFTVLEVVLLGATVPGFAIDDAPARAKAVDAIRTVDLTGFEDRDYTELSGGERQRVHIARALCQLAAARRPAGEPAALLLDEPTANLDLAHQGLILAEAKRQARMGCAVLTILHDLNLAAAYADEIVLLSVGRVVAAGSARDVLEERLLSRVFSCSVRVDNSSGHKVPVILPAALSRTGPVG